jgi:hypothetical protein
VGYDTGHKNIGEPEHETGYYNTFIGSEAGWNNIEGRSNTFIGYHAGYKNIGNYLDLGEFFFYEGSYNTFIGHEAGYENTLGMWNTFIGNNAGQQHTSGVENVFIGNYAGRDNIDGNGNVFIGSNAGALETGSNKLYIDNCPTDSPLIYGDFEDDFLEVNGQLQVIGKNLLFIPDFFVDGNSTFSGNLTVGGSIYETSDGSLKNVSGTFTRGLDALERLQPVQYRYKVDNALNLPSDQEFIGLLAQDVQAVIPEAVEEGPDGYLLLDKDPILWTMLNAIKELKAENDALRTEIELLKKNIQK